MLRPSPRAEARLRTGTIAVGIVCLAGAVVALASGKGSTGLVVDLGASGVALLAGGLWLFRRHEPLADADSMEPYVYVQRVEEFGADEPPPPKRFPPSVDAIAVACPGCGALVQRPALRCPECGAAA